MAKSLKIPKGSLEAVNQGTNKTMAKSLKIPKGSLEAVNQRTNNGF
jgi:hypothetical protein